ncbi:MAG: hypothetical protein IJ767_03945 [Bacteroidaceae bacterium]|nr:hypothetical protein [Bacteroidaceae bacterium]
MTIQDIKQLYESGLQAVNEAGMKLIGKHNRKNNACFMAENEDWIVDFSGPSTVVSYTAEGTPIVKKGMVRVSLYNINTDEEGDMEFDDPKKAMRFLKLAVLNPAKAAKRMDMYICD